MELRIKTLRKENNLSQHHIADFLGLRQQTYSRYELGLLEPSLPVMAKIAAFYGTSVDYLIGLTDDKEPYPRTENTEYPDVPDIEELKKGRTKAGN